MPVEAVLGILCLVIAPLGIFGLYVKKQKDQWEKDWTRTQAAMRSTVRDLPDGYAVRERTGQAPAPDGYRGTAYEERTEYVVDGDWAALVRRLHKAKLTPNEVSRRVFEPSAESLSDV